MATEYKDNKILEIQICEIGTQKVLLVSSYIAIYFNKHTKVALKQETYISHNINGYTVCDYSIFLFTRSTQ